MISLSDDNNQAGEAEQLRKGCSGRKRIPLFVSFFPQNRKSRVAQEIVRRRREGKGGREGEMPRK